MLEINLVLCMNLFTIRVLLNTVSCYVRLHGYGYAALPVQPDWYIAMAINDVMYVNASSDTPPDDNGFFTYIIHPDNCGASDFQYFNTYSYADASTSLINYLQALTDGRSHFVFLHKFVTLV